MQIGSVHLLGPIQCFMLANIALTVSLHGYPLEPAFLCMPAVVQDSKRAPESGPATVKPDDAQVVSSGLGVGLLGAGSGTPSNRLL